MLRYFSFESLFLHVEAYECEVVMSGSRLVMGHRSTVVAVMGLKEHVMVIRGNLHSL
jgi:hypothetical protein